MKNKLNAPNWSETGQNKYSSDDKRGNQKNLYRKYIFYYAERRRHI